MEQSAPTNPTTSVHSLPPIADLFKQSWDLLTLQFGRLLLLWLYNALIYLGAIIAFFVVIIALGIAALQSTSPGFSFSNLPGLLPGLLTPQFIILAIISFIVFVVGMAILGFMYSAAVVLLLHDQKKEKSPWQHYKEAFSFVWPLFITGAVAGLIALGSIFFFFIPYIIVLMLFSMYMYVIILDRKQGMEALRMSAAMVWQNFWSILLRFFIIWISFIVVSGILSALFAGNKNGEAAVGLLQFGLNIFLNVYALTYMFTLYKHARKTYRERTFNLTWIWAIAIIGWIIAGLVGFFGFKAFQAEQKRNSEKQQKYEQQWQQFNDSIEKDEQMLEEDFNWDEISG